MQQARLAWPDAAGAVQGVLASLVRQGALARPDAPVALKLSDAASVSAWPAARGALACADVPASRRAQMREAHGVAHYEFPIVKQ
jgi:hypothetical protein